MKKMLLIVNPCAGTKKINKYLVDVVAVFNRAGYDVTTYITADRGDATEVAAERAKETDVIVCCGGDGTFNETINGVLRSGHDVPLGYIPAGSTNDFANSLRLPADPIEAAWQIAQGVPHSYDVGLFGQRYFSYVASFGAFTKASYQTAQSVKNELGHTAYILESLKELSQIRNVHVKLELDGEVVEDDFLFGAISNSTSVGGILTLDPKQVDMSDGKFEVLLVRSPREWSEIPECIQAVQKQQYNCRMITFRSAQKIKIEANPDIPWTLDGEREEGHDCVEVANLHHAIRLLKKESESC